MVPDARAHDGDAIVTEAETSLIQQTGRALGDTHHLVHVENVGVRLGRHLPHAANDVLRAVDGDETVEAKVLDSACMLVQVRAYFRRRLAPGRGHGAGVDPTQRHDRTRGVREDIAGRIPGTGACMLRCRARCCPSRRPAARRCRCPKRPGTTAMIPPLTPLLAGMPTRTATAGVVVHAAGRHHAQHALDVLGGSAARPSRGARRGWRAWPPCRPDRGS